jgi:SAM-dependent methyltransferase
VALGLVLVVGGGCTDRKSDQTPNGSTLHQLLTGESPEEDRSRWDRIYSQSGYVYGTDPSPYLVARLQGIAPGKALDIAMGEGRNGVFLAKKGFSVEGVDLSEVALKKAKRLARENGVTMVTTVADLTQYKVREKTYSLILMIDYFQRSLIPQIRKGLRPDGVFLLEGSCVRGEGSQGSTFIQDDGAQPLQCGEAATLLKDFSILHEEVGSDKSGPILRVTASLKRGN